MPMANTQGGPQSPLEKFIERLNSDPQYLNRFVENPAGVFVEDVDPNTPQSLQTQLNEYVKKRLTGLSPKTVRFKEEQTRNAIDVAIEIYLG
jgi:hypothetical protein